MTRSRGCLKTAVGIGLGLLFGAVTGIFLGLLAGVGIAILFGIL